MVIVVLRLSEKKIQEINQIKKKHELTEVNHEIKRKDKGQ